MRRLACAVLAGGLLLAAEGMTQKPVPTVHESMTDVIAPQANVLWEVSNGALDDDGNPDASRMKPAQWDQIAAAGQRMHEMAVALATADRLVVAAPGAKIDGEDGPEGTSAAQVQGFIDADHAAFVEHARALAAAAETFVTAAKAKDAAKLGEVAGTLDQVCEACHIQFWYPNQAGNAG